MKTGDRPRFWRKPGTDPSFVLADTLSLWGVDGSVSLGEAPVVATVRAGDTVVSIERAPAGIPFRWFVRWSGRETRPRACASVVGVLNAVRGALGVERGSALRIASTPNPLSPRPDPLPADAGRGKRLSTSGAARAAERLPRTRIPVSVITGFLGSGKTTLLGRLLRDPGMSRTAVIINEFGAVGLDHDLIETSDESFVQLSNGCLCCHVRSDLVLTLVDLAARRAAGAVPPFERVVIETSGLADPAPILHALMTDSGVTDVYSLDRVITTVDTVTGLATLDAHEEALRQATVADTIVLTKTDIPEAHNEATAARVAAMNPGARVLQVVSGAIAATELFNEMPSRIDAQHAELQRWIDRPLHDNGRSGITSCSIVREEPVHAATLALFLSALAENCGTDLLRMKGIVHVAEEPQRPAVVHGVQHVYHAPEWMERWPSADRRTRMVFIGRGISESWVRGLLDTIEDEVAEETTRRVACPSL